MQYPEHKFERDIELLERKHVRATDTIEIGKKSNIIDEQSLGIKRA